MSTTTHKCTVSGHDKDTRHLATPGPSHNYTEQVTKRSRTDDAAIIAPDPTTVLNMVKDFDTETLKSLLVTAVACDASGATFSHIQNAYDEHKRRLQVAAAQERARVIDFSRYSGEVWHTLNKSYYTKLSGSKQYDAAYDVYEGIIDTISQIRNQVKAESSFGTKISALETIRKIAKTVILADDTLGHEVRNTYYQGGMEMAEAMLEILNGMSAEDRLRAGAHRLDEKGTLLEKSIWVRDAGQDHVLEDQEAMNQVLELLVFGELGGDQEEGDEEDFDDEEDEEEYQRELRDQERKWLESVADVRSLQWSR